MVDIKKNIYILIITSLAVKKSKNADVISYSRISTEIYVEQRRVKN